MKNIKGTKFRMRYASETMSAPSSSSCSSQNSSTMEYVGKMGHPSLLKQAQIGAKVPSVFSSEEVSFKGKTNQLIKDDREVLTKLKTLIRQQQRVCSKNTENYRDMLLTTQLGRAKEPTAKREQVPHEHSAFNHSGYRWFKLLRYRTQLCGHVDHEKHFGVVQEDGLHADESAGG